MHVVSWILDFWVPSSLGANTLQMVGPFGRGLIGVFFTNDWLQQFVGTWVFHLRSTTSDHVPIWIVPDGLEPPPISKPFRFEEMWLLDKGCGQTVEVVWRAPFSCDLEVQVMKKIAKCGTELTQWSRRNFESVRRELAKKKKLLVKVEQAILQSGNNS